MLRILLLPEEFYLCDESTYPANMKEAQEGYHSSMGVGQVGSKREIAIAGPRRNLLSQTHDLPYHYPSQRYTIK